MANDCDAVLIGICCCHGVAFRGNPVVGAVGETASMKRRKFWKTGGGGGWAVLLQQCHPNSAGSLVIARRTE